MNHLIKTLHQIGNTAINWFSIALFITGHLILILAAYLSTDKSMKILVNAINDQLLLLTKPPTEK